MKEFIRTMLLCFLSIFVYARLRPATPIIKVVPQKEIMSIREQQQFLNSQNHSRYYCGEIDGIPGPKLFKAIDNWTCDRQAIKEFE